MHSLPLTSEGKQKEWMLIQQIAQNNNFRLKLIQKLKSQVQRKQTNHDQNNNDKNKKKSGQHHTLRSNNTEGHQYIRTHKRGNILQE
jgi:hypothetical protein